MITRDNYEEFFLLYTDNELSAAERQEVERFVADHPDLGEEWEALLQCRLAPGPHVAFPDRDALLKPELEGSAYTGTLLSYLDGELDPEEAAGIEAILHDQPRVAMELAVLRQTVSHPDHSIVFPDKDRLYQTEKGRRIIPLPWLRAGIAAAIAGAIALILLLPKRQQHSPVTGNQSTVNSRVKSPATHDNIAAATNKVNPVVTPSHVTALHYAEGQPKTAEIRPAKPVIQKRGQQPRDTAVANGQDVAAADSRNATVANGKEVPPAVIRGDADPSRQADLFQPTRPTEPVTDIAVGPAPAAGDLATNVHSAVQTGIPKDQSSFATLALQQPTDDEPDVRHNPALRGIFRKVARTIGKTAERDNDGNRQVTVGSFRVSLD